MAASPPGAWGAPHWKLWHPPSSPGPSWGSKGTSPHPTLSSEPADVATSEHPQPRPRTAAPSTERTSERVNLRSTVRAPGPVLGSGGSGKLAGGSLLCSTSFLPIAPQLRGRGSLWAGAEGSDGRQLGALCLSEVTELLTSTERLPSEPISSGARQAGTSRLLRAEADTAKPSEAARAGPRGGSSLSSLLWWPFNLVPNCPLPTRAFVWSPPAEGRERHSPRYRDRDPLPWPRAAATLQGLGTVQTAPPPRQQALGSRRQDRRSWDPLVS